LGCASPELARADSCLDQLRLAGDPMLQREVRDALEGRLAVPASGCRDVELRVDRADGVWTFTLVRDGRLVVHAVRDVDAIVSWVESWLSALPPRPIAAPAAAPEPTPAVAPPQDPLDPSRLSLRALVDVDPLTPFWPGAALSIQVGLGSRGWIGASFAGAWAPEQSAVERKSLRLSVRGGGIIELDPARLTMGVGSGVVFANAKESFEGATYRDEEGRVFFEAIAGFDLPLSRAWALSIAAVGRAHLPDSFGGSGDGVVAHVDPAPLATAAVTLEIGVSYGLGAAL